MVDEYVALRRPAPGRPARPAGRATRTRSPQYRIDEQLAKALERKVWLPSGGSLVIDKTEAMTVVDVNTGQVHRPGRQPGRDRHPEQPGGRRGDRPPAAAARRRRHHRHRLHRHGAGEQPRAGAAAAARVPGPGPDQAPGRRGDLARPGPDDQEAGRRRAARGVLRAVRVLQRPRRHPHLRSRLRRPRHAAHALPRPRRPDGNGGQAATGGRRTSPATVAARARSAEPPPAPQSPAADAPARRHRPPRRRRPGSADAGRPPRRPRPLGRGLGFGSGFGRRPRPTALEPDAAQQANGQVPDAEPEPARSSGRRRRRKPAAAASPAAEARRHRKPHPPRTAQAPAPDSPGAPAAPDSSPVPVTSGAPEAPRPEPSAAEMPPAQDGVARSIRTTELTRHATVPSWRELGK